MPTSPGPDHPLPRSRCGSVPVFVETSLVLHPRTRPPPHLWRVLASCPSARWGSLRATDGSVVCGSARRRRSHWKAGRAHAAHMRAVSIGSGVQDRGGVGLAGRAGQPRRASRCGVAHTGRTHAAPDRAVSVCGSVRVCAGLQLDAGVQARAGERLDAAESLFLGVGSGESGNTPPLNIRTICVGGGGGVGVSIPSYAALTRQRSLALRAASAVRTNFCAAAAACADDRRLSLPEASGFPTTAPTLVPAPVGTLIAPVLWPCGVGLKRRCDPQRTSRVVR